MCQGKNVGLCTTHQTFEQKKQLHDFGTEANLEGEAGDNASEL